MKATVKEPVMISVLKGEITRLRAKVEMIQSKPEPTARELLRVRMLIDKINEMKLELLKLSKPK